MQAAALRALEFDRIREALAREASTSLGRERARTLTPADNRTDVQAHLDLTLEAAAFVKSSGSLTIDGPDDLEDVLGHLEVADQPLAPLQLLGLARFASSVSGVVDRVRESRAARLGVLVADARSFIAEADAVRRAIDSSGDVKDSASQALQD